jgi:hypothetical protein
LGCAGPQIELEEIERPNSGRALVLQALIPPEVKKTLSCQGVISTLLSSTDIDLKKPLKGFPPGQETPGRNFSFRLRDGTQVEGLFFEY